MGAFAALGSRLGEGSGWKTECLSEALAASSPPWAARCDSAGFPTRSPPLGLTLVLGDKPHPSPTGISFQTSSEGDWKAAANLLWIPSPSGI